MIPGNRAARRSNMCRRFSRISSRTDRDAMRSSLHWLRLSSPRVAGFFPKFPFGMRIILPFRDRKPSSVLEGQELVGKTESRELTGECQSLSGRVAEMSGDEGYL